MLRSDEFFNLIIDLDRVFHRNGKSQSRKYAITQNDLNYFNCKHNLPMERLESLNLLKAKDIFLEQVYLSIKSIINPEIHFNFMDIYYNSGVLAYNDLIQELGENFTIIQLYDWRKNYYNKYINNFNGDTDNWLERLSKIRAYFKQR